jgi:hypothetical protein
MVNWAHRMPWVQATLKRNNVDFGGPATVPQVISVEHQIERVEGFAVRILWPSRRDVRSDKAGIPGYVFVRAAKADFTVFEWKQQRFQAAYPGYIVEVLDGHGRAVGGNTKLATVRASYADSR